MMQGQNQVMGMGDTGVQTSNCLFQDTSVPITGFLTESGGYNTNGQPLQYFDSMAHRKIRCRKLCPLTALLGSIAGSMKGWL